MPRGELRRGTPAPGLPGLRFLGGISTRLVILPSLNYATAPGQRVAAPDPVGFVERGLPAERCLQLRARSRADVPQRRAALQEVSLRYPRLGQ